MGRQLTKIGIQMDKDLINKTVAQASNKSDVPAIAALGKETFELNEELTYAFLLHICILQLQASNSCHVE